MTRSKPLTEKVLRGLATALVSGMADAECNQDLKADYDDMVSASDWVQSQLKKRRQLANLKRGRI